MTPIGGATAATGVPAPAPSSTRVTTCPARALLSAQAVRATSTAPASTTRPARCGSSRATGSSAATPISRAIATPMAPAITRTCRRVRATASRPAARCRTTIRTATTRTGTATRRSTSKSGADGAARAVGRPTERACRMLAVRIGLVEAATHLTSTSGNRAMSRSVPIRLILGAALAASATLLLPGCSTPTKPADAAPPAAADAARQLRLPARLLAVEDGHHGRPAAGLPALCGRPLARCGKDSVRPAGDLQLSRDAGDGPDPAPRLAAGSRADERGGTARHAGAAGRRLLRVGHGCRAPEVTRRAAAQTRVRPHREGAGPDRACRGTRPADDRRGMR